MASPHSLDPNFTPGARLSRLPMRTGGESLEDFYRDLFASPGPEHDRQSLLRLLDEDVADGAAATGRSGAMDHLGQAFRRIDAWTLQGDSLPQADRTELKRRVAHNLLAARPGLTLATRVDGRSDAHAALLREVQAEHAAWRQGWAIGPAGPGDAPYGRRPWAETSGPRQPRQPWDEQAPRQGREPADALRRLGRGEPLDLAAGPDRPEPRRQDDTKTYWYVTPKPTACGKCLAMAGKLYPAEPERPHPNCTCRIEARTLTPQQAAALQEDLAHQARALHAEHERIEREKQAAQVKAHCPAYVDDRRWRQDGDPVSVSGKATGDRPVRQTFKGHALPDKTPGGVKIKTVPTADRRVTKEMSDTLQEVLDDPRCKQAGITSVTLSATSNGKHSDPEDRHYKGKAVDVAEINGKPIGKNETAHEQAKVMQEVIKDKVKERGIKDNLGPRTLDIYAPNGQKITPRNPIGNHDDHVHIAIF